MTLLYIPLPDQSIQCPDVCGGERQECTAEEVTSDYLCSCKIYGQSLLAV